MAASMPKADCSWSASARDQHRNLEDAREKVRALVRRAMIRPRTRRPTRVTAAAKARRLDEKKRRSAHKRRRGSVRPDED
jgi:ribosome-associated protein